MKQNLGKAMVMVWKIEKKRVILAAFTRILLALVPVCTIWLTKELINELLLLSQTHASGYASFLFLLFVLFLVSGCNYFLTMVNNVNDAKMEQDVDYHLSKLVSEKAGSVPIPYFDQPAFYNLLHRIQNSMIGERFLDPVKLGMDVAQNLITLTTFLVFLFNTHWGLGVLTLLTTIPIFLIQTRFGIFHYLLAKRQTPEIREAHYIHEVLTSRESAKEVRIFQLKEYLMERWSNLLLKNMREAISLLSRRERAVFFSGLFTVAMYVGSLGLSIYLMYTAAFPIGDFVALAQTVQNTQQLLSQIAHKLSILYRNSLYISDFFSFLEYRDQTIESTYGTIPFPADFQEGIEFDQVCFQYPGQEKQILHNVSFKIHKGERIAIVGENGSGKTTLLNCLMGLYPVTTGSIRFDQVEIAEMKKEELHQKITVIFQDFIRYYFSVKDNIGVGNIREKDNLASIKLVAQETGADSFVTNLSNGYDTYMGRILRNGEDLSGGQWQKIALSRALFRQGEVFILDEPTAALDPLAELEVFKQFESLTRNKTAIFISHRMAATRLADRILVMKNGRVVEFGHHNELIENNGVYANMYRMQAKWYA